MQHNLESEYLVIVEPGFADVRELGSRFFGSAYPVSTPEEIEAALATERKRHYDATHWCYAARWGLPASSEKSSDAGEPAGTAGLPILQQIRGKRLTNTLVIVTRYFGGTKLGTGGLVRMYGAAAHAALDVVKTKVLTLYRRLEVRSSYDDIGIVYRVAERLGAQIEVGEAVGESRFLCNVRPQCEEALSMALRDESGGRIKLLELGDWIC